MFPLHKVLKTEIKIIDQEIWQCRIQLAWLQHSLENPESTEEERLRLETKCKSTLKQIDTALEYRAFLTSPCIYERQLLAVESGLRGLPENAVEVE